MECVYPSNGSPQIDGKNRGMDCQWSSAVGILVLCWCVTNDHNLSVLKPYPFVLSQFCTKSRRLGALLSILQGRNQGVGRLGSYLEALEEVLPPGSFRVLQNSFPVAIQVPSPSGPSSSSQQWWVELFSCSQVSVKFLWFQLEKVLSFWGLIWLDRADPNNLG